MINIELHVLCLFIVITLFINMRISCRRDGEKPLKTISCVYILCAIVLISDCLWSAIADSGHVNIVVGYVVNLIYFLSSNLGTACWFLFCISRFNMRIFRNEKLRFLTLIPCVIMCVIYVASIWTGWIFSIVDGAYVRGSLFFIDPVVKLGYICSALIIVLICAKNEKYSYLRKKDYSLILYSGPVIICGILQIILEGDFNCLGFTLGLIFIYLTGVTNNDSDNIDAVYSLAHSFDASYLVNIDTGKIRSMHKDRLHSSKLPEIQSRDYETHFLPILEKILVPEDKMDTLNAFDLENVLKRFEKEKTFTIRYRVTDENGKNKLRMASFIHASGRDGREEFLLGISSVIMDRLLYERNETLRQENERLEEINRNILLTVAGIVEARDSDSGDHIIRVKELSKILANKVKEKYPEYGLDDSTVDIISSASTLHDVGKVVIPDAILLKPGRLTPDEFEIMKTHTSKGNEVLNKFPLGMDDAFIELATRICRSHHEKYDGKGYPDGLVGDEIPISAQIVSVVDCYDALVSERPYKKALPPEVAVKMILDGECGAFSDKMKDCLISSVAEFEEITRAYGD